MTARPSTRPPARGPVRPRRASGTLLWGVVIGGVALLGVLAVALSAGSDDADLPAQTRPVEIGGEALAPYVAGEPDPAIGQPMPELRGEDFAGTPVEIADDGRAKAIAFLAHWCPHCRAEVPRLAAFLEGQGMPPGVDLYLVPTGTDPSRPNYPPQTWLEGEGLGDVPTLVDNDQSAAMGAAGGTGFPYWVFVDADGAVAGRLSGELPDGVFGEVVGRLAAGEPLTGGVDTGPASDA